MDRAHQVGHFQLAEIQRFCQYIPFVAGKPVVLVVASQNKFKFVGRIMRIVTVDIAQTEQAQYQIGAGVEQPDCRIHQPIKAIERRGAP